MRQPKPTRPRDLVLELVEEGRPYQWTRRRMVKFVALRTGYTKAVVSRDIGRMIDAGVLVWVERPEWVRGPGAKRLETPARVRAHVASAEETSHQNSGRVLGVRSWS